MMINLFRFILLTVVIAFKVVKFVVKSVLTPVTPPYITNIGNYHMIMTPKRVYPNYTRN